MTTHPIILAGIFQWTEEPGGLQSMGLQSLTWWTVGWEDKGRGGMYGESSMKTYITICKIDG